MKKPAKKRKAPLPWKEDGYESLKDYKEQIRMNVRELNRDIDRYELDEKKFTIKDMEDEYRKRGMYGDLKKRKAPAKRRNLEAKHRNLFR